jgi:hypothetical protein
MPSLISYSGITLLSVTWQTEVNPVPLVGALCPGFVYFFASLFRPCDIHFRFVINSTSQRDNSRAANTEVANVESAALAYYADNDGTWPTSDEDLSGYLSDDPVGTYQFDDYGKVGGTSGVPATGDTWGSGGEAHDDVVWNDGDHEWKKSS